MGHSAFGPRSEAPTKMSRILIAAVVLAQEPPEGIYLSEGRCRDAFGSDPGKVFLSVASDVAGCADNCFNEQFCNFFSYERTSFKDGLCYLLERCDEVVGGSFVIGTPLF